jgi:colanic acid/amylovoran biosynthesis glycosyltransferase
MSRALRIAIFVHEFPALSETFVLNQITGLLDRGHDVTIIAAGARSENRVQPEVITYGLARRTRYPSMPQSRFRRLVTAAGLVLRYIWSRPQLVLGALSPRRFGKEAFFLMPLFRAVGLAREAPFDALLCHFGSIGQMAAHFRDIGAVQGKLVTIFHGVDVSAVIKSDPDHYRFLFAEGDLFLAISRRWCEKLVELGCDPSRLAVHRMGVDVSGIPFRPRQQELGRPLAILSVGRLIEKKGFAFGLEAMAELAGRGVDLRYDIVGDGPLRESLKKLASDLGIESRVTFHGVQDRNVVAALMAKGDVLLAPSVTAADGDQEGIPVTIMEAMAAGMLVVATNHSGIPELVEQGRSGLLVAERDVAALAEALESLARRPGIWAHMSEAARKAVMQRYEIGRLNAELEGRLRSLAARNARDIHGAAMVTDITQPAARR